MTEAELFASRLLRAMDRLVGTMDLLTPEQVAWQPPIPGWNSMATIVFHMTENLRENILGVVGGEERTRDREAEFREHLEAPAELREGWQALRPRAKAVLSRLSARDLDATRAHPRRGEITVREILLVMIAHVGQHEGHAQMTRDFLLASGPFVD